MMRSASRHRLTIISFVLIAAAASASNKPERTQFGHDIRIEEGERAADATCFGCNVYVKGDVDGDVTVFDGNVVLGESATVSGDVTLFMGDARLDEGAKIGGDATIFGGVLRRHEGASVSGDVTNFGSKPFTILILLSPFIVLALLIALVVWLVQRSRRPATAPAVPGGYR
jgi:hypothetical protein